MLLRLFARSEAATCTVCRVLDIRLLNNEFPRVTADRDCAATAYFIYD